MNIVINEALKAYIDPLTAEEHEALERSILREGCRDALVLWGDLLVDGHNRYGICKKHGLPFKTVQSALFESIDDVYLWMIDQHLGRRSVSDFQRGVLALRKRDILTARAMQREGEPRSAVEQSENEASPLASIGDIGSLKSREALARAARLSSNQVVLIEKIQKQAVPEVVAAVRAGTISMNAAAAVATLPAEQQLAAAAAGKEELKQAAKRVRERKRVELTREHSEPAAKPPDLPPEDTVQQLKNRVAELEAENVALRMQLADLLGRQIVADSVPK